MNVREKLRERFKNVARPTEIRPRPAAGFFVPDVEKNRIDVIKTEQDVIKFNLPF